MPAEGGDQGDARTRSRPTGRAILEGDAHEQRRLFEAREAELVARYPGQTIAMCAGEVFVGKTPYEAAIRAKRGHPGRATWFHAHGVGCSWTWQETPPPRDAGDGDHVDGEAWKAEIAVLSADVRVQQKLFEAREAELVARYPRQTIAMCAGEVFVGKTPYEAAVKAKRAHPDRASWFHSYGTFCVSLRE